MFIVNDFSTDGIGHTFFGQQIYACNKGGIKFIGYGQVKKTLSLLPTQSASTSREALSGLALSDILDGGQWSREYNQQKLYNNSIDGVETFEASVLLTKKACFKGECTAWDLENLCEGRENSIQCLSTHPDIISRKKMINKYQRSNILFVYFK